jgi:Ca-activated chloride channel homolog
MLTRIREQLRFIARNLVGRLVITRNTQVLVGAALLLCAVDAARAQEENEVVRVNTNLVVLNVTVTERSGQYVSGLRASDFKIYEDGKEVPAKLVSNVSLEDTPFAAVVLLDTSGSMETRLTFARSAAIRFLDCLRDEDVAAVYRFDTKIEQLQDFSAGRDLANLAFGIKANGMTVLNDAIVKASSALAQRSEKRKAIVVLSDGQDTYSKVTAGKALDIALAAGASIYTVDMSATHGSASRDQQSAMVLKNFAEKSGARFIATPGGSALREAFASIAQELGHQYTIAYRPLNPAHDGRWHNIEVKVSREDLNVRTRKGYRAAKS